MQNDFLHEVKQTTVVKNMSILYCQNEKIQLHLESE